MSDLDKSVFLSLPMRGFSNAQIDANIAGMISALEAAGYLRSEMYNNFYEKLEDEYDYTNPRVALLSRAIEKIGKCDAVAFLEGWENANGCVVEHEVAKRYGLEILYIDKEYNIRTTYDEEQLASALAAVKSIEKLAAKQDKQKIIVKYLKDEHHLGFNAKLEKHGNFYDLSTANTVTIAPESYMLIPLGVAMKLPEGYYAEVVPRSSTFKKYGIIMANSEGIIDTEYCGDGDEWHFPAYNTRKEAVTIPQNERICQFTIHKEVPTELYTLAEGEKLGGPNRGGFGSTDKKPEEAE